MLTFPYALLVAFIVHSITAIAKNPPTTHDMEVASRKMKEFKTPVVFRPTASDFLYVKDNELKVWIIDMDDSFLLGSGAQGSVRRAWRATVGVPPAKAPQYVVKQIDVDKSEDISKAPYTNEIDVLKALGRAPSHILSDKQGSLGSQGTVRSEYTKCKSIQSENWGDRCNKEAEAFIFQLLIPGTRVSKLNIYFNPEAMTNIQEGARRELKKLHKLGWVHGDAHPGNFLASESDTPNQYSVTMIDFGLSHEVNKRGTNVEQDFLSVEDFLQSMRTIRFGNPFKLYCEFDPAFAEFQFAAFMEKYFEEHFGHVEDWRIKFDGLKELHFATVRWESDGSPWESIESLPYFQSLFKQTMSKDTAALLPNTHAARLLKDAQLAKTSLETAIRQLSNAFKRAFAEDTRGRYSYALSRAKKVLVALSHEIDQLQSKVAREDRLRAEMEFKNAQASPQPSSSNSFSFSLLETMSTAAGLVYFALAVTL